ncbi:MAG TPA: hypothetical protein VFU50_15600, partial [Terriglobales bacterium]|nr:hypothetical protein [Terriglobales bacterium]
SVIGAWQYSRISQVCGGGRPEKVIVFLKSGEQAKLAPQTNLDRQLVELAFRRGSKLRFQSIDGKDGQFLVIDTSQIDHLYVGSRISELSVSTPP